MAFQKSLCVFSGKKVKGVMGLGALECDRLLVYVPAPQCVLESQIVYPPHSQERTHT